MQCKCHYDLDLWQLGHYTDRMWVQQFEYDNAYKCKCYHD
jgi:hypothetical protein